MGIVIPCLDQHDEFQFLFYYSPREKLAHRAELNLALLKDFKS